MIQLIENVLLAAFTVFIIAAIKHNLTCECDHEKEND
jgi:hypothetical protein